MSTRHSLAMVAIACAVLVAAGCSTQSAGTTPAAALTVAEATVLLNDGSRPEADTKRDADRKPADMVAFAGIKPGDKVVDFIPAGGYFTRVFSRAVGTQGHRLRVRPEGNGGQAGDRRRRGQGDQRRSRGTTTSRSSWSRRRASSHRSRWT